MIKYNVIKKLHNELAKIKYKCKDNCYSCCTWFTFLESEKKIIDKELKKQWYSKPPNGKGDTYCEYLTTEWKCSIYQARPIICRSFSDKKILLWTREWKQILTPSCTYWQSKYVIIPSNEYLQYSSDLLTHWMQNKNAINVMNEFIWKYPLFDIPNHLK